MTGGLSKQMVLDFIQTGLPISFVTNNSAAIARSAVSIVTRPEGAAIKTPRLSHGAPTGAYRALRPGETRPFSMPTSKNAEVDSTEQAVGRFTLILQVSENIYRPDATNRPQIQVMIDD